MRYRMLLMVAMLSVCTPVSAATWCFLPGDSYFQSELTKDVLDTMEKVDEVASTEFYYREGARAGDVFDTFLGYGTITVRDVPRIRRRMIRDLYHRLRKTHPLRVEITTRDGQESREELNGIPLLLYNRDFDGTAFSVGLRYNEDWVEDEVTFGIPRWMANYPVIGDVGARHVLEDWHNARVVSPLAVRLPEVSRLDRPLTKTVPLTVKSEDVQIIVVLEEELEQLRLSKKGASFYIIGDKEARKVIHGFDGWITKPVE